MADKVYNVLFLCTGNSARSILAESMLSNLGAGRFRAYSAGSHPKGEVHPLALALLQQSDLPTEGLRSKTWDEFAVPGAPCLDFIITVCDDAAGELCPAWPGRPMTAHWGIPDPAAVEGTELPKKAAFQQASKAIGNRLRLFLSLPLASIDQLRIKHELDAIGKTSEETP